MRSENAGHTQGNKILSECAPISLPPSATCLQGPPVLRGLFGSLRGYKGDISPAAALDAVANQREPAPELDMLCSIQLHAGTAPPRPPVGKLLP